MPFEYDPSFSIQVLLISSHHPSLSFNQNMFLHPILLFTHPSLLPFMTLKVFNLVISLVIRFASSWHFRYTLSPAGTDAVKHESPRLSPTLSFLFFSSLFFPFLRARWLFHRVYISSRYHVHMARGTSWSVTGFKLAMQLWGYRVDIRP